MATPHHDRHLGEVLLVTLSVRSEHGLEDALAENPEAPYPSGTLAVYVPRGSPGRQRHVTDSIETIRW